LDEKNIDWPRIAAEYIAGNISYRQLAEKHGVGQSNIERRAKKEGWVEKRRKSRDKRVARLSKAEERKQVRRVARFRALEDKLLDKFEQAVDELDLTLRTKVKKTKVIEYNNEKRPDKPTKETVDEVEEVETVRVMIDRTGLAAITTALEKLKSAHGILSPLDEEEQKARIEALRAKVRDGESEDTDISVTFEDNISKFKE
jgi:transposase-like protein